MSGSAIDDSHMAAREHRLQRDGEIEMSDERQGGGERKSLYSVRQTDCKSE